MDLVTSLIVQWQGHCNFYRCTDFKRNFGTCLSTWFHHRFKNMLEYCVIIFAVLIFVLPLPFHIFKEALLGSISLATKYLQAHIQYLYCLWILIKAV